MLPALRFRPPLQEEKYIDRGQSVCLLKKKKRAKGGGREALRSQQHQNLASNILVSSSK
eukprot:NODE_5145_length_528_cov_106.141962_g3802_i0.p2 GENE.NODE_5145_length_528_cov_106.141962_g3802_i0~~NODE_5145_length_528_cov_106.141962_g3802_i0.p2  ORF type:complete len:59 (-),score=11.58 NODE_5145_length_528_cov_106.141962_g3802_i0:166-342(-)